MGFCIFSQNACTKQRWKEKTTENYDIFTGLRGKFDNFWYRKLMASNHCPLEFK
jgi:outer membrane receptor for ferric coprogen and ferric-rhodotorulic acid